MADIVTQLPSSPGQVNGPPALEEQLRCLVARQIELRSQLECARAELQRVTAELLRIQQEYGTSPEREEEYWQCWKRIEGSDPRDILRDIEAAKQDRQSLEEFLAELEQTGR